MDETSEQLDLELLLTSLNDYDAIRAGDAVRSSTLERIEPKLSEGWPHEINAEVRASLEQAGLRQPYEHQVHAASQAVAGRDVVLESPTASGKTLAFTVPMLHILKQHPRSHALMIYPMKALAYDQREQIRALAEPLGIESWPYDGDTGEEPKKAIRQRPPRILLTNPEYLNMSFLGQRHAWNKSASGARFLKNLRYVVIDEMHEYRGFFGSNMALLLRRFFRYLAQIGAKPQVFLSTATCANPKEHASALTGRNVEHIAATDALRPRRHFVFVAPDIPDFNYNEILRLRVEQSALTFLRLGLQVLIFCPSKKFLEAAFANVRKKAAEQGHTAEKIAAYHADLLPDDRQTIQERIQAGDHRIIFATNALEIGVDIGGMDGVVLAGFPPNVMSAWQQVGRAGRGWQKDAFVLYFAMNDPIDRFFVHNLNGFLNRPFDHLVVDPENSELIDRHLPSLVEEAEGRFRTNDVVLLGERFHEAAVDAKSSRVQGYSPQARIKLRGTIGSSFMLRRGTEDIGRISGMRKFREAYLGATLTFYGRHYTVRAHESDAIVLEESEPHLKTEPKFFSVLNVSEIFDGWQYGDVEAFLGAINMIQNFSGYRLVDERTGSVVDMVDGSEAHYANGHHAFWIQLPNSGTTADGLGALEHMLRVGAMFAIPIDRFDTSTYSRIADTNDAFLYENFPGGIGASKRLLEMWPTALKKGVEIALSCDCTRGCQNCIEPAKSWSISNSEIDKRPGIKLAEELLVAHERGPDSRFSDGLWRPC